jgi:hypothetical protein
LDVPALELIAIDKAVERLCDDVSTHRGIKTHFTSTHVPRSVPHDVARPIPDRAGGGEPTETWRNASRTNHADGNTRRDSARYRDLGSLHIDESDVGLRVLTMRERVAMVVLDRGHT